MLSLPPQAGVPNGHPPGFIFAAKWTESCPTFPRPVMRLPKDTDNRSIRFGEWPTDDRLCPSIMVRETYLILSGHRRRNEG